MSRDKTIYAEKYKKPGPRIIDARLVLNTAESVNLLEAGVVEVQGERKNYFVWRVVVNPQA